MQAEIVATQVVDVLKEKGLVNGEAYGRPIMKCDMLTQQLQRV